MLNRDVCSQVNLKFLNYLLFTGLHNEVLKAKFCEMLNFDERYEERNCFFCQHCGQQQCPDLIT